MRNRITALTLLAIATAVFAGGGRPAAGKPGPRLERDDLPGPQPEAVRNPPPVTPPAVPSFELPALEPGFHAPRELRVHGKSALGTEIKVKGYVTWIYDCANAIAVSNPKLTREQIQQSIAKNPALCEHPKLYLGDAKDTPHNASLWVVDAAPNKPTWRVGDYVVVTGTWATQSPGGEHSTDGLLIFHALEHAVPATTAAATAPSPASDPDLSIVTRPPMRTAVNVTAFNASADHLKACNKLNAASQFDAAIAECQSATQAWAGNHLAWYAWASAHMAKSEWPEAKTAVEHAVTLRPDQAMYQLYYGISLYEAEHQRQGELARQNHKSPDDFNPSDLKLDDARDALIRAAKLGPDLWRAHYYLGRLYRDLDDARHAAEQFTQTITTNPGYRYGYIALIELYRRWSYLDQAIAVATLGTVNVAPSEASDMWYELGLCYGAQLADDQAIDAFGKAITGKPDDASAKFQRGQIYFRKGDFTSAERDLADVVTSTDPALAAARQLSTQLRKQMAAKKH